MTVGERPTVPLETERDPDRRRARREATRRARRRRRIGGLIALSAVVAGGLLVLGADGQRIPPKVSVAGVDIGGLSVADARARLEERARAVLDGQVRVSARDDPAFSMDLAASTLASAPRVDEAIASAVGSRGRFGRALARLGLAREKELPLRFTLRTPAVDELALQIDRRAGRRPVSATVKVEGTEILTTPSQAGRTVDRPALAETLGILPASISVVLRAIPPPGDDLDARRARELALRIVATPHAVTLGGRSALLVPAVARKALRFPLRGDTIAVELDPGVLRSALVKALGVDERGPADARLEIRGDVVAVIPSLTGRRLDARALGAAIHDDPDASTITARVQTTTPGFTTAEAKALGIREKVSEFTTPYRCCQPRVANIQRAAQVLNGRIVPAGSRFSLNAALGERTSARGYVEAPTIAAGELVDTVGGGVSQVATTMYNAAFFAGLALEAHTPHDFYISRYPMGREATISWSEPDLVFRNDWKAAILMSVRAASNGITVAFYSSKLGRRVETSTGEPTNPTRPRTIERKEPDLPPGTRRVVQSAGAGGFKVSYTRKVYQSGTLKRDETYRWTYRPQNAIVEVGPPKPKPKPAKPPPREGPGDQPGPRPPAAPGPGGTLTSPTAPGATPPPAPPAP